MIFECFLLEKFEWRGDENSCEYDKVNWTLSFVYLCFLNLWKCSEKKAFENHHLCYLNGRSRDFPCFRAKLPVSTGRATQLCRNANRFISSRRCSRVSHYHFLRSSSRFVLSYDRFTIITRHTSTNTPAFLNRGSADP